MVFVAGCGGHTARTLAMRTALDQWQPQAAIAALDEELDVKSANELPKEMQGDNALLVLDRASLQQSVAAFPLSQRDFGASDKAIDMLDVAHNAGDTIGEYVFSGSSGKYVAPPYEKLLINTLNMVNYLELGDLPGAKVEARRLSVMQRYLADQLHEEDNSVLGLGSLLSGFAFEKDGEADEALHYYDDMLRFSGFQPMKDAVRRVVGQSAYTSPRLQALGSALPADDATQQAEIVFVVGYGRVPHKIAKRLPIGLALTLFANDIHPGDVEAANRLAAQGLVTWINFPSLGPERGGYTSPTCRIDARPVALEDAVDVSREVRKEWRKIEGKVVASAVTRLIARLVVGQGIQAATKDSLAGLLVSLGTQATLTVLDTPDTRSWETLPARIAIARVRVPAGEHDVMIEARGVSRRQRITVAKGGWKVVSLMALR